jgi:hypothetical protein
MIVDDGVQPVPVETQPAPVTFIESIYLERKHER